MQLKTVNGQLKIGSAYWLCATGFGLGFGVFFMGIFLLILVGALVMGEGQINGEAVQGRGALLLTMLPALVFAPIAIAFNALIWGGMMTLGLKLYTLRRPITVVETGVAG